MLKKLFLILPVVAIILAIHSVPEAHADNQLFECYPVSIFKCGSGVTSISTNNGNLTVTNQSNSNTNGSNIISLVNYGTVSGVPTTASGSIGSFQQENVSSLSSDIQASQPRNSFLPYGIFNFYVTGLPVGGTTDVTITFTKPIPAGAQYWKIINGEWIDATQNATINGNQLIIHLKDGGSIDEDGIANGQVIDPSGLLFFNNSPPSGSDDPNPNFMKPSFGDVGDNHYSCGLKINGACYDVNKFMIDVPKNIVQVGSVGTIDLKIKPIYGSYNFESATIYGDFTNPSNPTADNAQLAIQWDKNQGFTIIDKNHVLANYTATEQHDMDYQFIHFKFVAAKPIRDTNLILQALDDYNRINKVFIRGAVQFGPDPVIQPYVQPPWLQVFNSKIDLENALIADHWNWTTLPTKATYPNQVFTGGVDQGTFKYFYDTKDGIIVGEILNSNKDPIWESPMLHLTKIPQPTAQDERYANQHLNYADNAAIDSAKKHQELQVARTLQELGINPCVYNGTCSN